jgi:hypothetical protein
MQSRTPVDNETQERFGLEYQIHWLDSPKYSENAQLSYYKAARQLPLLHEPFVVQEQQFTTYSDVCSKRGPLKTILETLQPFA